MDRDKAQRILAFILSLVLTICIYTPITYAASGTKTVYVLTKVKATDLTDNYYYVDNLEYDKNGFLIKLNSSGSDKYSSKSEFVYNKKKQANKENITYYKHGTKYGTGINKFSYSGNGYLSKTRNYYAVKKKNKTIYYLSDATYYTWTAKGKISRIHDYLGLDESQEEEIIERYEYNESGKLTRSNGEDSLDDITYFRKEYIYPNENERIYREYRRSSEEEYYFSYDNGDWEEIYYDVAANGPREEDLQHITKEKYSNGRITRKSVYDARFSEGVERVGEITKDTKYTYKKIKVPTKDYNKVVKQQKYILQLIGY